MCPRHNVCLVCRDGLMRPHRVLRRGEPLSGPRTAHRKGEIRRGGAASGTPPVFRSVGRFAGGRGPLQEPENQKALSHIRYHSRPASMVSCEPARRCCPGCATRRGRDQPYRGRRPGVALRERTARGRRHVPHRHRPPGRHAAGPVSGRGGVARAHRAPTRSRSRPRPRRPRPAPAGAAHVPASSHRLLKGSSRAGGSRTRRGRRGGRPSRVIVVDVAWAARTRRSVRSAERRKGQRANVNDALFRRADARLPSPAAPNADHDRDR